MRKKLEFFRRGQKKWNKGKLPNNVSRVEDLKELSAPKFKGGLSYPEKVIKYPDILEKSVIYRPKSLVVGVGLHSDTSKHTISEGIEDLMQKNELSLRSIRNISTLQRDKKISGLHEFSSDYRFPVQMFSKGNRFLFRYLIHQKL